MPPPQPDPPPMLRISNKRHNPRHPTANQHTNRRRLPANPIPRRNIRLHHVRPTLLARIRKQPIRHSRQLPDPIPDSTRSQQTTQTRRKTGNPPHPSPRHPQTHENTKRPRHNTRLRIPNTSMDTTQKGNNPMASIVILIAGSTLTYLTLLTLAKLDKTGKLEDLKTYLRKYPPH